MSRSIPLLAAFAVAVALGACSKPEQRAPTSQVFRETSAVREGTVADLQKGRILFWDAQNPAEPVALRVSDQTTVVRGGDFVDRDALKEGEAVRVFYDDTQQNPQALRVEILTGDEADQIKKQVENAGK